MKEGWERGKKAQRCHKEKKGREARMEMSKQMEGGNSTLQRADLSKKEDIGDEGYATLFYTLMG